MAKYKKKSLMGVLEQEKRRGRGKGDICNTNRLGTCNGIDEREEGLGTLQKQGKRRGEVRNTKEEKP